MQLIKKLIACVLLLSVGLFTGGGLAFAQQPQYYWQNESISVATSPKTPTGEYSNSGTLRDLGVFQLRANNGSVRLREMTIGINGSGVKGRIDSIALYNNAGHQISDKTVSVSSQDNVAAVQKFNLDVTIPANSVADIYVKGIVSGITSPSLARIYVSLSAANGPSIVATSQRGYQVYSYSNLSLPSVGVRTYQENPSNLSKTRASASVWIGIPYENDYTLYNGGEKLTLNSLELNANNPNAKILGISFVVDGRTFSKLVSPYSAYDSMTLSLSELKEAITINKGDSKTLKVLVYATGISTFQGKLHASRTSGSVDFPFTVTYR